MIFSNFLINQWLLCARACFDIPAQIEEQLRKVLLKEKPVLFAAWARQFTDDLFSARYGYSSTSPQFEPYTEICIETLLQEMGVLHYCQPIASQPTLCISHDIDHLCVSSKLALKRLIGERKITSFKRKERNFIPSLNKLLELSAPLSPSTKSVATVFVASPLASKNPLFWPMQWLMDPSYTVHHPFFPELRSLIDKFQCDVGLHGSFYSMSQNFLEQEKKTLESAMNKKVDLLRQHWLHLPGEKAWNIIKDSKFQIDSTLGWNGSVGFRGGMARPFEILTDSQSLNTIWEVPLLLMDGPLFCDMKIPREDIAKCAKSLLTKVIQRNGCVSINWHDRAAHPSYKWDSLLEEVLTFAVEKNFQFLTLKEAVEVSLARNSSKI